MGVKAVIAALVLAGGCYFFFLRHQQQQRVDFCEAIYECLSPNEFARDFISMDRCVDGVAGEQAMADFSGCDPDLKCDDWLACGYGLERNKIEHEKPKTNFEQILPEIKPE